MSRSENINIFLKQIVLMQRDEFNGTKDQTKPAFLITTNADCRFVCQEHVVIFRGGVFKSLKARSGSLTVAIQRECEGSKKLASGNDYFHG